MARQPGGERSPDVPPESEHARGVPIEDEPTRELPAPTRRSIGLNLVSPAAHHWPGAPDTPNGAGGPPPGPASRGGGGPGPGDRAGTGGRALSGLGGGGRSRRTAPGGGGGHGSEGQVHHPPAAPHRARPVPAAPDGVPAHDPLAAERRRQDGRPRRLDRPAS